MNPRYLAITRTKHQSPLYVISLDGKSPHQYRDILCFYGPDPFQIYSAYQLLSHSPGPLVNFLVMHPCAGLEHQFFDSVVLPGILEEDF